MLENSYFICVIQEPLTPSVRNPTQTWGKSKVNLSAQYNWEGQSELTDSGSYSAIRTVSLLSLDASFHRAGEIVAPQAYKFHNARTRARARTRQCFCMVQVEMSWEEFWLVQLWPWGHLWINLWLGTRECFIGQPRSHGLFLLWLEVVFVSKRICYSASLYSSCYAWGGDFQKITNLLELAVCSH